MPTFIPYLVILLGTGWLLTALGFAPGIDWIWTVLLAGVGLIPLATSGVDKFSIFVGPLFLMASVLSILRQTGNLSVDVEVPVLVILSGLLMLVAKRPSIPNPAWYDANVPKAP